MTSPSGFLITLACSISTGYSSLTEPKFSLQLRESQADPDDNIWLKIASLEHTFKTTLSSVNNRLEAFSTDKANLLKDITAFKVDLKEELEAFKVAADDVMMQQTTQHEQFIKEMTSKYDTMVEQTNGRLQQIQADVLNTKQDQKGQTTRSPMVAFSAGLTNSTTVSDSGHVVYDKIFIDLDHAYNNVTGEFVAPVAGIYEFHYHVLSEGGRSIWLELVHNDRYVNSLYCHVPGRYGAAGNSAMIDIDAGDVVYVRTHGTSVLYGRTDQIYCTFSGHLLHPRG